MAERKVKQWITVNGVHVPIFEGESKADGVKRAIEKAKSNAKANEDQKAKDIAKNQAEKDKLNGKESIQSQAKMFAKLATTDPDKWTDEEAKYAKEHEYSNKERQKEIDNRINKLNNKSEKGKLNKKVTEYEEMLPGEKITHYQRDAKKYGVTIKRVSGNEVSVTGTPENLRKYYNEVIGVEYEYEEPVKKKRK